MTGLGWVSLGNHVSSVKLLADIDDPCGSDRWHAHAWNDDLAATVQNQTRPNRANQAATWPRNTRKDADSMAAASAGDSLAHPLAPSALKELEKAMRPGTARATVTESIMIARASRTAFTAAPGKKSC
jgi:hypothetical protein